MARFTADVDSPPAKPVVHKIKEESPASAPSNPAKRWNIRFRRHKKTPHADTSDVKHMIPSLNRSDKSASHVPKRWFPRVKRTKASDSPPSFSTLPQPPKLEPTWSMIPQCASFETWTMDEPEYLEQRSIRNFKVAKKSSPTPNHQPKTQTQTQPKTQRKKKKTRTRITVDISILLAIVIGLGYFGVRDLLFKPPCDKRLPKLLSLQIQLDLHRQIFRQDTAIHNLTTRLKAHEGLTVVSLVGGCGTGKSLTAKVMAKHYTEDHVHAYQWGVDDGKSAVEHVAALQEVVLGLPACQPQLVIVDNLGWPQKPHVEDMQRWLRGNSRLKGLNVVIVFVFNWDRYGEETHEEEEKERELQTTNFIKFKNFQETDAMDYLVQRLEREGEGSTPPTADDSTHLELMVANANVPRYGLKRLANKFETIE